MHISDKLKAIVAALGTLVATLAAAAEDSSIEFAEVGGIIVAAIAVGTAVYAVRNRPALA